MAEPRWKPVHRIIPIAQPALGAELDIFPNSSAGWLVRTIRARLTTSAAAGTRSVSVAADDTITEWYRAAAGNGQGPSLQVVYGGFSGSAGASSLGPVTAIGLPADGLWLPQGCHLRTITNALDAGDQWDSASISIIEFPTGPDIVLWPFVNAYSEEAS